MKIMIDCIEFIQRKVLKKVVNRKEQSEERTRRKEKQV